VDRLQLSLFSFSILDYPKLSLIIYIRKQHNGLPFRHSAVVGHFRERTSEKCRRNFLNHNELNVSVLFDFRDDSAENRCLTLSSFEELTKL
jgi:hypothetical protein